MHEPEPKPRPTPSDRRPLIKKSKDLGRRTCRKLLAGFDELVGHYITKLLQIPQSLLQRFDGSRALCAVLADAMGSLPFVTMGHRLTKSLDPDIHLWL